MYDDESILYQEEDERIAFGLNMVYNTNEVDSVTFDKPSQLKSMELGWMGMSWNKVQRFVVPPLQGLEMIASEFQVRSEDGFGTDNMNYVARFKSKAAAKTFAKKYKKAESDKKFTLRTLGRNRRVPAYLGMMNEEDEMKNVSYNRADVNYSFPVLSCKRGVGRQAGEHEHAGGGIPDCRAATCGEREPRAYHVDAAVRGKEIELVGCKVEVARFGEMVFVNIVERLICLQA